LQQQAQPGQTETVFGPAQPGQSNRPNKINGPLYRRYQVGPEGTGDREEQPGQQGWGYLCRRKSWRKWKYQRQEQKADQNQKADAVAPVAGSKAPFPGGDLGFDMQIDQRPDQAWKDIADEFQVHSERRIKSLYAKELIYHAKKKNERNACKHYICRKTSGWSRYQKNEKKKALR
jgi:hypothetical protein